MCNRKLHYVVHGNGIFIQYRLPSFYSHRNARQASAVCERINTELCKPVQATKDACSDLEWNFDDSSLQAALQRMRQALETKVDFVDTVEGK